MVHTLQKKGDFLWYKTNLKTFLPTQTCQQKHLEKSFLSQLTLITSILFIVSDKLKRHCGQPETGNDILHIDYIECGHRDWWMQKNLATLREQAVSALPQGEVETATLQSARQKDQVLYQTGTLLATLSLSLVDLQQFVVVILQ